MIKKEETNCHFCNEELCNECNECHNKECEFKVGCHNYFEKLAKGN